MHCIVQVLYSVIHSVVCQVVLIISRTPICSSSCTLRMVVINRTRFGSLAMDLDLATDNALHTQLIMTWYCL